MSDPSAGNRPPDRDSVIFGNDIVDGGVHIAIELTAQRSQLPRALDTSRPIWPVRPVKREIRGAHDEAQFTTCEE